MGFLFDEITLVIIGLVVIGVAVLIRNPECTDTAIATIAGGLAGIAKGK